MTEKQLIKTINSLLIFASFCTLYGVMDFVRKPHTAEIRAHEGKNVIEAPEVIPEGKQAHAVLTAEAELRNEWQNVKVTYKTLELDYIGRYFITSYCPEECGYNGNNYPAGWRTSSGTICHYSETWSEPTTCAIDRSYGHGYGELIQVGDADDVNKKIYVTEDTGPGVQGAWIDCFVLTMDEVKAWPTGWRNCYAVSYQTHTIESNERTEKHEHLNSYLHYGRGCGWIYSGFGF